MPDHIVEEILSCNSEGDLSDPVIEYCSNMAQWKLTNQQKLNPHGKHVVECIEREGKLAEFVKQWRSNFLEHNEPKYLPTGWRIDHKILREFGEFSAFQNIKETDQTSEMVVVN